MTHQPCHVCGSKRLEYEDNYRSFQRVTSDCKPWPAGGEFAVCGDCGIVQATTTEQWRREADEIYKQYAIYHQSGGVEQSIFDQKTGKPVARSARLLEKLHSEIKIPSKGKLLDIGCGNGQLLRNASTILPEWSFSGTEFDERHRETVLSIRGAENFYTGQISEISETFDIITLVHVLEHLTNPQSILSSIKEKLSPEGLLVIDVPDFTRNPFISLVADHCTHFSTNTAAELLRSSGYEIQIATGEWIPKESVVVARKTTKDSSFRKPNPDPATTAAAHETVIWLDDLRNAAKKASLLGRFGIFGTSIAATFLKAELGDSISFFLDEDPARIGKSHLGLPIYHPSTVPKNSHVFIPLAPMITREVVKRLSNKTDTTFHWLQTKHNELISS